MPSSDIEHEPGRGNGQIDMARQQVDIILEMRITRSTCRDLQLFTIEAVLVHVYLSVVGGKHLPAIKRAPLCSILGKSWKKDKRANRKDSPWKVAPCSGCTLRAQTSLTLPLHGATLLRVNFSTSIDNFTIYIVSRWNSLQNAYQEIFFSGHSWVN